MFLLTRKQISPLVNSTHCWGRTKNCLEGRVNIIIIIVILITIVIVIIIAIITTSPHCWREQRIVWKVESVSSLSSPLPSLSSPPSLSSTSPPVLIVGGNKELYGGAQHAALPVHFTTAAKYIIRIQSNIYKECLQIFINLQITYVQIFANIIATISAVFFFLTQNIIKIFSRPNSNLSKEKKRVRSDNQASIYFPQIL